jgi:ribosomal protein S12 methylthiotransferase
VDELGEFIRETKFERLGVFRYSQEEGTRGAKMENQIPKKTKEARWHRLMALQKEIAADVSRRHVGRTLKVLVEEPGVARGEADAPDIDGRVYVPHGLPVGEFVEVKITGYHDYDLLALPKGQEPAAYKVAKQAQ